MSENKKFVQGNEACVDGALYAGLDFYAGYPITPSTEIAELLAYRLPQSGGKFAQSHFYIRRNYFDTVLLVMTFHTTRGK